MAKSRVKLNKYANKKTKNAKNTIKIITENKKIEKNEDNLTNIDENKDIENLESKNQIDNENENIINNNKTDENGFVLHNETIINEKESMWKNIQSKLKNMTYSLFIVATYPFRIFYKKDSNIDDGNSTLQSTMNNTTVINYEASQYDNTTIGDENTTVINFEASKIDDSTIIDNDLSFTESNNIKITDKELSSESTSDDLSIQESPIQSPSKSPSKSPVKPSESPNIPSTTNESAIKVKKTKKITKKQTKNKKSNETKATNNKFLKIRKIFTGKNFRGLESSSSDEYESLSSNSEEIEEDNETGLNTNERPIQPIINENDDNVSEENEEERKEREIYEKLRKHNNNPALSKPFIYKHFVPQYNKFNLEQHFHI